MTRCILAAVFVRKFAVPCLRLDPYTIQLIAWWFSDGRAAWLNAV